MVVAYHFAHNEGVEWGTLEHPDEWVSLTDLYECDGTIKAFETRQEAEAWLGSRSPSILASLANKESTKERHDRLR